MSISSRKSQPPPWSGDRRLRRSFRYCRAGRRSRAVEAGGAIDQAGETIEADRRTEQGREIKAIHDHILQRATGLSGRPHGPAPISTRGPQRATAHREFRSLQSGFKHPVARATADLAADVSTDLISFVTPARAGGQGRLGGARPGFPPSRNDNYDFGPKLPKRLLKRASWPPVSSRRCWPPVQAGCDFGSMSRRSVSPSLP